MFASAFGIFLLAAIAAAAYAAWRVSAALGLRGYVVSDWQVRAFICVTLLGCLLVGGVELASVAHAVSAGGLTCTGAAGAAVLFWIGSKLARGSVVARAATDRSALPQVTAEVRLLVFISALIALILFLLAILTPPTSWDSFTYHLPRVLNWIQNRSLATFATQDTRQIESGPLASFAVMQLYLVTGSDRLVNLVQWGAMLLSVVGVSWLTTQAIRARTPDTDVGKVLRAPAWTALFAMTMPVGIVQSITTQTDYVVAFWVVSAAVFGLLLCREPANPLYALLLGAALGLGTITKATMVVTAGLLTGCILIFALRASASHLVRLRILLLVGLTSLVIVAPHFIRNIRVFGSPLGSRYVYALMRNEHQTPGIWVSNFFRNLSLHAASGIPPLTRAVNSILTVGQSLSGRSENDRASTFFTSTFSYISGYPISDNSAGNFWHGLIALLGSSYVLIRFPSLRKWTLLVVGIVTATFLLQSGYLRWTEWNARFHLPLFLLLSPIAGIAMAGAPQFVRAICFIVMAIVGCHAALYNKSRPVLGENDFLFQERERQYFIEVPTLYRPVLNTVTDVIASGSTNVGLRLYKNFFLYLDEMEYPFWVMLRNRGFDGKIYNLGVTNETARFSNSVPIQTVISSTRGLRGELAQNFPYVLSYPPIDVYWSESSSRWVRLAQVSSDGTERTLVDRPCALDLNGGVGVLACRVARQGVLSLKMDAPNSPEQQVETLMVKSFAGYANASRSTNGTHTLEIPLPAGQTAIQLGLAGTGERARQLTLNWNWSPVDSPLPFAYISRIYDPAETTTAPTKALSIPRDGIRGVQLIAGAAGEVDLTFFSAKTNAATLNIAARQGENSIVLTNGVGATRVLVERGTNQFRLTNRSGAAILLESADAIFRRRLERFK